MKACEQIKRICDEIIEAVSHGDPIDGSKFKLIERIAHEQQHECMGTGE